MPTSAGVFAFVLTALFVSSFPAGATTPRWALLAVVIPLVMLWRETAIPRGAWLLTTYITASALLSPNWWFAANDYCWFVLYVCVFAIGRTLDDLRPVFVGAALGLWGNSLAIVGQVLDWWYIPGVTARSGLFTNVNFAVESAAMVVAGLAAYRVRWAVVGVLPTLFAGAKAPILALGVVAMLALWDRSRRLALGAAALAAVGFVVLLAAQGFALTSFEQRLAVWQDMLPAFTLWGHGLGAFTFEFPTWQVRTNVLIVRFEHPHSDPLQLLYEFGVVGILLCGLFLRFLVGAERNAAWFALVVFTVEGLFEFPLYMPVTGCLAAVCLGHLSRPRAAVRGAVDDGGLGVRPWAAHQRHRGVRSGRPAVPA